MARNLGDMTALPPLLPTKSDGPTTDSLASGWIIDAAQRLVFRAFAEKCLKMYTDKTRELFAGLIERPPLTDQLLQRPPFRFLHDVVNATIQNTGFLTNIFTNEELDASNVTDKTAKISFLKKLIKALNDDGSLNEVKAAKIVAGKEPEMTNLLNGYVKEEKMKEKKVHKKDRGSKSEERRNTNQDENRKIGKERRHASDRSKEKRKKKETGSEPKQFEQTVESDERRGSIDEGHFEDAEPPLPPANVEEVVHTDQEPSGTAKTEDSGIADDITNESEQPSVLPAVREQQRLSTSSGRPRTSAARPGTAAARPAPPKLKKKQLAEIERKPETDVKTTTVIADERRESDEDFVVEVEPSCDQIDQTDAVELITEEHGGLVRKILNTKNKLEEKMSKNAYNAAVSVFDEKEQAKLQQELADLQRILQQITQTTHPLARLFDSIQEDADSMIKEIEEWRMESRKNMNKLRERKANAEGTSESLLVRLNELDEQIKEVKSAIVQAKANTIASEEKIRDLINNI